MTQGGGLERARPSPQLAPCGSVETPWVRRVRPAQGQSTAARSLWALIPQTPQVDSDIITVICIEVNTFYDFETVNHFAYSFSDCKAESSVIYFFLGYVAEITDEFSTILYFLSRRLAWI